MNDQELQFDETPSGMPRGRKRVLIAIAAVLILLIVGILLFVGYIMTQDAIPDALVPEDDSSVNDQSAGDGVRKMLPFMAELYAQNPDIAGWIRIEGTKLDYPVMYTPEDEEKYFRANFEGKLYLSGLPFIDKDCSMDPESQNLIIYGHNMKNGTAFKTLFRYTKKSFWEETPTIYFATLYEERTYEIVSVFYDKVYKQSEDRFKFYHFIDPATEEEFDEGIEYFKRRGFYDTGVDAEYGDKLITLVTCSYHTDKGRLVVVARQVTDDAAPQS